MSRSVKTLALWVLLIVIFVALYRIFSSGTPGDAAPGGVRPWSFMAIFGGAVLVFVTVLFVFARRNAALNAVNQEGVNLLQQGRYSAALEKFEEYRRRQKDAVAASFNIAVAQLALWQPAKAAVLFEQVASGKVGRTRAIGGSTYFSTLRTHAQAELALAQALLGNTEAAARQVTELETSKELILPTVFLTKALLACRAGQWAEARQQLIRHEVQQLGGRQRALSEVLLAWTSERTGAKPSPLNKVAFYGETGPEQVRLVWPELVDFVDRAPSI